MGARGPSALSLYTGVGDTEPVIYRVPFWKAYNATGDQPPPTQEIPVRVSQRRDLRPQWQISHRSYPPSGALVLDPFRLPFLPSPGQNVEIQWFGVVPAGCALDVQLFDGNGTQDPTNLANAGLTSVSSGSFPLGGFRDFAPVAGSDCYQPRVTFSGTGTATPTLLEIRILRNGNVQTVTPGEFRAIYPACVTRASIVGQDFDPSHESASLAVSDLTDSMPLLGVRGEFATVVDTQYSGVDWSNPSNDGLQSVLFRGYTLRVPGERRGSPVPKSLGSSAASPFPAPDWREYSLACAGNWKRLAEALVPFGWDFGVDPSDPAGQPYKATDVFGAAISWAGFPVEMVDIGPGTDSDSPIRLFPRGQLEGLAITPGQNLLEFVVSLAWEYLGMRLIFDANATAGAVLPLSGVYGCWRLVRPPVPPYNTIAAFVTQPGPGMLGNLAHMLSAYPTTTSTNGQIVQAVPIWKGSLTNWTRPPEADLVVVTGTGEVASTQTNQVPENLTKFAANPVSFDFFGQHTSDPAQADYVGRIKPSIGVDSVGLTTPGAVSWAVRRAYDATCRATKFASFSGPLVLVTDVADTRQVRPRPLRTYDVVTVDGASYAVRSVNPIFHKDAFQFANYECAAL